MVKGRRFGSRWLTLIASVGIALPLLAMTASSSAGAAPKGGLPPGLQPTEVNVTNDLAHRYGEPVVMANPKNPNNLVYFVLGPDLNRACEQSGDPLCTVGPFGFPNGLLVKNGWQHDHVFVTFDRGRTWAPAKFPNGFTFPCCPPAPPPGQQQGMVLEGSSDPNVAVTADGTFYIGFDIQSSIANGIPAYAAGVGASKSTDGGLTWSPPVVLGTPIDRPWMVSDLSTGTVYETSGSPPNNGTLGPFSTGDPNSPLGNISDRWLVSSQDGVHWTTPHQLASGPGCTTLQQPPPPAPLGTLSPTCVIGGNYISAAHGVLGATFRVTAPNNSFATKDNNAACLFFVGTTAPCTVFQTTTDSGVTWTRHLLPVPSNSTGTLWVAADPSRAGHFTVAVLNSTSTQFLVYQTVNSGSTWTGPTAVAEDATTDHFKPWINYSAQGVLGLMWRTDLGTGNSAARPVTASAVTANAVTANDATAADEAGCGDFQCPPPGFPDDSNDGDPPNGSYSVWAAISHDGGATFTNPLEISKAPSPTPPAGAALSFDDDSFISLDGQHAYIAWADWRPGERSGFFSDVKLQAFTHGG
jgi:hypothetical protein